MPNYIKNSTSTQTLALHSGNFWIGTGDVKKGPTITTNYWNSIPPPLNGYTIYLNQPNQGPSIYTVTGNTQLINLTNQITSLNNTTIEQTLNYYKSQSDRMVMNFEYPKIPTNGLTYLVDIGSTLCYQLTGTTGYSIDPTTFAPTANFVNGASYTSEYGGGFQLDGIDDYAYATNTVSGGTGINLTSAFTYVIIARSTNGNNRWMENLDAGGLTSTSFGAMTDGSGFLLLCNPTNTQVIFLVGGVGSGEQAGILGPTIIGIPHMYAISSNGTNLHKGYVDNLTPVQSNFNITRINAQSQIYWGVDVTNPENTYTKMNSYVQLYYNRQLSDTEVLDIYDGYKGRFGF